MFAFRVGPILIFLALSSFAAGSLQAQNKPEINYYGQRNFRASGEFVAPMFVANNRVFLQSQYGQITAFELPSGKPSSESHCEIPEKSYVSDTAITPGGDLFALSYGRVIEIRGTKDPAKVIRKLDLPPINEEDLYYFPQVNIAFNESGDRLYAYDKGSESLIAFSVKDGKSQIVSNEFPISFADGMMCTFQGDILLHDSDILIRLDSNGKQTDSHATKDYRIRSLKPTKNSVFAVCSRSSKLGKVPPKDFLNELAKKALAPPSYVLIEFEIDTFKEKFRWSCDSGSFAVLNNRPVFRRGKFILQGSKDGQIKKLFETDEDIDPVLSDSAGKYIFGSIPGGLRCWETETGTPDSMFRQPDQRHTTFGIGNTGILHALTSRSILKPDSNGLLVENCKIDPPLSPVNAYHSLSADGNTLAIIRKNVGAYFYTDLLSTRTANKPIRLEMPNNSRPERICLSADGKRVSVRFDPNILLDDLEGSAKRVKEEFKKGFTEGFFGELSGKPNFDETCAIFELPSKRTIAVNKVGGNAMLLPANGYSPKLWSGAYFWAAGHHIGSWNFKSPESKPKAFSISPHEVVRFCDFNQKGDAVFGQSMRGSPDDEASRVFWLGAGKKFTKLIAIQKKKNNEQYLAALPNDGKHIYLGKSESFTSTISKIKIRGKKVVWKLELPTRLERMRLSPNGRFLGVKLNDSRYAVISNIE